jgi:hypothetical protein
MEIRTAVVIESKRDERVLAWLVAQVGEQGVADACVRLAGGRKAYPSNIAKALGLTPPKNLSVASRADALRHLEAIASLLGVSRCT